MASAPVRLSEADKCKRGGRRDEMRGEKERMREEELWIGRRGGREGGGATPSSTDEKRKQRTRVFQSADR